MMKAYHSHQRHKSMPIAIAATWHTLDIRRSSSRHPRFLSRVLHLERAIQAGHLNAKSLPLILSLVQMVPARIKRSPHHDTCLVKSVDVFDPLRRLFFLCPGM
jgi:hypothetical protein